MNEEPYVSILNLLQIYGIKKIDEINIENGGLKAYHFMYALGSKKKKNKTLEKFFEIKYSNNKQEIIYNLKSFQNSKWITSGCITNSDRLNKCLLVLSRKGWIKKSGRAKYYIYSLTPKFYHDIIIINIKNDLKTWKKEFVITNRIFDHKLESKGYSVPPINGVKDITWSLSGISPDLLDMCNDWEIAHLHRTIINLEFEVKKIAMYKIAKAGIKSLSDFFYQKKSIKDFCCISLYINVNPILAPDHYFPKDIEEAFEKIKSTLKENNNGINNIKK